MVTQMTQMGLKTYNDIDNYSPTNFFFWFFKSTQPRLPQSANNHLLVKISEDSKKPKVSTIVLFKTCKVELKLSNEIHR